MVFNEFLTDKVRVVLSVPRLASAVTLARARTRGAGPPRTVQQHINLPDLGRYRTLVMIWVMGSYSNVSLKCRVL